jgi:hypothetical protein
MKRSLFTLVLLGLVCGVGVSLLGCGAGGPAGPGAPAASQGSATGNINGISYEIHGGPGQRLEVINNNFKITRGANVIEIKDGRVLLNGIDRGPIKSGDSLVLDSQSRLSVNSESR